jgi:hypothetical protein
MKQLLMPLWVMLLLLGYFTPDAYARRGGWAQDPVWRKREAMGLATVLAVAVFAYGANRILNPPRKRDPSQYLDESPVPPESVKDYLSHREPQGPVAIDPSEPK